MKRIQQQTLDQERALYGMKDIEVVDCAFDGPADGESALKEGAGIKVERCYFNLRYPFWHDHGLVIRDSRMTELCRAALWYSDHIEITHTALHGIKALRECSEVTLRDCDIISPEFGWSVHGITMEHCTAQSEYFMMRSTVQRTLRPWAASGSLTELGASAADCFYAVVGAFGWTWISVF